MYWYFLTPLLHRCHWRYTGPNMGNYLEKHPHFYFYCSHHWLRLCPTTACCALQLHSAQEKCPFEKSQSLSEPLMLNVFSLMGYQRTNPTSLPLMFRWRYYVACCICLTYPSRLCLNCAALFWLPLLTSATAQQQRSSRACCWKRYITEDDAKYVAVWHIDKVAFYYTCRSCPCQNQPPDV